MEFIPSLRSLVALGFFGLSAGPATAQTVAEALDTPSLTWTPSGTVTPLNNPALSHDGVDVLRIDATTSAFTGGPYPSVKYTVTVPTVVEFWHRSQDLSHTTILGRSGRSAHRSSVWKQQRWLQWPGWGNSGELEFENRGERGSPPLYLDEISLRPAASVGLAEALDFPGFVRGLISPVSAVPIGEGWLAPDGSDAVVFPTESADLSAVFPRSGVISFRSAGEHANPGVPAVRASATSGMLLPSFVLGDRSWTWIPEAGEHRFQPSPASNNRPQFYSQIPIVLDALEQPAEVPVHEALDAPGLTFSVTGIAAGLPAPAGAADGDALLCLQRTEGLDRESAISLTVSGPGVVRFSWLGSVDVKRTGQTLADGGISTTWRTFDIPVYRSGETITWKTRGDGFWLNAVSVLPPSPETSVAGLLNVPFLAPEVLVPANIFPVSGRTDGDPALSIAPISPTGLEPVLRIPFEGDSVLSLMIEDASKIAQVRIDGGAWQAPNYVSASTPFVALVPGSGPHTLEVTGPVILDQLKIIPRVPIPLAEALDAPELTFTTSPGLPWSGYRLPPGSGYMGDHAATGGMHATVGDPWIETSITGPGVLKSKASLAALIPTPGIGGIPVLADYLKQYLDGVLTDPYFTLPEIWIQEGTHTVRWVQRGSQIQNGIGTLPFLDSISFTPTPAISISTALDTPNRSWTRGGTGAVIPNSLSGNSPDGIDSVMMIGSASAPAWVETTVRLPCLLNFKGRQIGISMGGGPGLFGLNNTSGIGTFRQTLSGNGTARVRFTAVAANAVLDMVDFEQTEERLLDEITLGTPGIRWRQYGNLPWRIVPNESNGTERYRGPPNTTVWMEAMVEGPCQIRPAGGTATLPEHGNRPIYNGFVPYAGPQRVLFAIPANSLVSRDSWLASPPITDWSGVPGLTWTTGGNVPWQSVFTTMAQSGFVWPGETSWLEAEATGPGLLSWQLTFPNTTMTGHVLCNGVALPFLPGGKLHLGSGLHRIRWQVANPVGGARTVANPMRLESISFTPQPVGSVSDILSEGTLNFAQSIPSPPFPEWQIVNDPSLPGKALQGNFRSGSFTPLPPLPGRFDSSLNMIGAPAIGSGNPTGIAAAAPFPWNRTTVGTPPQHDGFETYLAQVSWTPPATVSIGEAVDLPELSWTAQSNPPGLWQALAAPYDTADPDGLYLIGAQLGNTASLETTLTGPLNLTTELTKPFSSTVGMRLLINGGEVATENQIGPITSGSGISYPALRIPAGPHVVRWEFAPPVPLLGTLAPVIRRITTSPPTSALPDVPALLDHPGLKWNAIGLTLAAITTGTNDGVDALALGAGGGRISFPLTGPGMASFYMKGAGTSSAISLDELLLPNPPVTPPVSPATWVLQQVPIPEGPHSISIAGNSAISLDQFSFTALPALTPEAALDAPAGVTVSFREANRAGAAAYPGLSDDGVDCLMLMPGLLPGIALNVPPLSSITLRVRSAFGTGTLGFQDLSSASTSTTWTTRSFSTPTDGGLSTVYIRAGNVPVFLDRLSVSTPSITNQYFPWATAAGLATSQQDTGLDTDGDGINNFTEYAFGLNPTLPDSSLTGSDTVPGLPQLTLFTATNGLQFLEVRYWRRSFFTAIIETATEPSATALLGEPNGWTTASTGYTNTNRPGEWVRVVWRSPTPIAPGPQTFARVRAYLP